MSQILLRPVTQLSSDQQGGRPGLGGREGAARPRRTATQEADGEQAQGSEHGVLPGFEGVPPVSVRIGSGL